MNAIEPPRVWSIGHQMVTGSNANPDAGYEEEIGTNWWDAANRLLHLINQWALDDDRARGDANQWQTGRAVGQAWHDSPPMFNSEAAYEIETRDGSTRRFYLAGERP